MWPLVEPILRKCSERSGGRQKVEDIFGDLLQCDKQLWVSWSEKEQEIKAACVTQVITYRSGLTSLEIVDMGGVDREISAIPHMKTLEAYGREKGCQIIEGLMRRGWAKSFPDFKLKYILLEKRLD